MDKDITQVTAVPAVRRMEIFWRTFKKVPRGLLFSKVPSKMSEEGLHWAPRSFMGFQTEDEWFGPQELRCPREDEPHALPTNAGLQMALPGMTFHRELAGSMKELDLTWNMHLLVEDIQGVWYGLLLVEPWRQGSSVIDTSQPLAMILAHELDPEKAIAGRLSFNEATALDCSLGLLVSINKIENDVIYVTAHDHLLIQVLGKDSQKCQSVARLCAQEVNLPHSMILEETYEALKERYKTVAIRILGDSATHDAIARLCRARGGNGEHENVLDFLLNTVVNNARIGDRSKIQKIPDSQQWCVD
ncbi:MAG: hypothetical protein Q9202_007064 [Teloschistes flavicans]